MPNWLKSTGPFGLAYAHMFNPTMGIDHHGLAILACLGSLLGWQFTIAQTGKAAAEDRMFPAFFSKVNSDGRAGHRNDRLGVVQTRAGAIDDLAELERTVQRAGESRRRHERNSLHHLACLR